jgi:hypothetical protein
MVNPIVVATLEGVSRGPITAHVFACPGARNQISTWPDAPNNVFFWHRTYPLTVYSELSVWTPWWAKRWVSGSLMWFPQVLGFFIQIDRGFDTWPSLPIRHFDRPNFAWLLKNFDILTKISPFCSFQASVTVWRFNKGSSDAWLRPESVIDRGCVTRDCRLECKTLVSSKRYRGHQKALDYTEGYFLKPVSLSGTVTYLPSTHSAGCIRIK